MAVDEYVWKGHEEEKSYSSDGKNGAKFPYFYQGYDNIDFAAAAFFANIDSFSLDMTNESGLMILDKFGPIARIADGLYSCDATYINPESKDGDKPDPPKKGEFKIEFDSSTITQKLTFSEEGRFTAYLDPSFTDAAGKVIDPNPGGAINFKRHDGKIEVDGVEVRFPALKFSISYRAPKAILTAAYVRILRDNNLCRNVSTFLGWHKKEVLFVGASGSQAVLGDPEIKFDFETDIEIQKKYGNIPLITKPPHDYLDIVYDTTADAANKKIVGSPVAAYVHNFFDDINFPALFGFGP